MSATPKQHVKQLIASDTASTDYDWITAGGASTQQAIKSAVIVNNDAVSQTVTIKVKKYSGSYAAVLTKAYTITAGSSEFIAELYDIILLGAASNPDKVTVAFGTTMTGGDTVDCLTGAVEFA